MFSKLSAVATFAILAVATAAPSTANDQACSTGPVQCCQQVLPAKSAAASTLLGAIGVVVQDLNIPIGLECSPISVIGVGTGNAW